MKRKPKPRNPIARELLEDKMYRPKKVISRKFKDTKHKLTIAKATEKDTYDGTEH